MSRVKNNLSKKMGGLRYTITEKEIKLTGGAPASLPRITWGEETEETANEVLDRERDTQGRRNNKQINLARVFLPVALEKGPRLARDLFKEAEAEGISPDQLKRAKYELNVQSLKKADGWWWFKHADTEKTIQVGEDEPL